MSQSQTLVMMRRTVAVPQWLYHSGSRRAVSRACCLLRVKKALLCVLRLWLSHSLEFPSSLLLIILCSQLRWSPPAAWPFKSRCIIQARLASCVQSDLLNEFNHGKSTSNTGCGGCSAETPDAGHSGCVAPVALVCLCVYTCLQAGMSSCASGLCHVNTKLRIFEALFCFGCFRSTRIFFH